jgi:TonB family protein
MGGTAGGWVRLSLWALAPLAVLWLIPAPGRGQAANVCGAVAVVRPSELPAVVQAIGGGCRRVELVVPVRWTYDAARRQGSLFQAPSPYPAVGLSQIELADKSIDIAALDSYQLSYQRLVPRTQVRTPEQIDACRRAHKNKDYPNQKEVARICGSQALRLTISFDNPSDIGLNGRFDMTPERQAALSGGEFLLHIGLRLDRAILTDDYMAELAVSGELESLKLTDAAGAVLSSGASSDSLAPPAEVKVTTLRRPSPVEAGQLYPADALREGLAGQAMLQCRIGHLGGLRGCVVLSEDPAGKGFGQAALGMARLFRLAPADPAGPSIAGKVVKLPIQFAAPAAKAAS